MKKLLKIFLITFIICCILAFLFLLRNYMIINQIYDLQANILSKIENSNNFLYEEYSTGIPGDVKTQLYFKDGIYKSITYFKDEISSVDYLNTNEPDESSEIDKDKFSNYLKLTVFRFGDKDNTIKIPLCQFIKVKDNQYIISVQKANPQEKTDIDYYYINKENGMIEKWETDGRIFTFKITENVVNDADITNQKSM